MEEIIQQIIPLIQQYGYIVVFIGTILAGETVILAAAFLASLGYFNIYIVIALSAIGIILADSFWYFVGMKSDTIVEKCGNSCDYVEKKIKSFKDNFNNHYGKFLIFSKFVYGARIATLIASGHQRIPYRSFLFFNIISILIWIGMVVFIGYVIGFSWHYLEQYSNWTKYLALSIVFLVVLIRIYMVKFAKHHKFSFDFIKRI